MFPLSLLQIARLPGVVVPTLRRVFVPAGRPNTPPLFELVTPVPVSLMLYRPSLFYDTWWFFLSSYPDPVFRELLCGVITFGARVSYVGPPKHIVLPNLVSATSSPEIITGVVASELAAGRLLPLPSEPQLSLPFVSSPLCLVPKPNGRWQRIHHLSAPSGSSVNDFVDPTFAALQFVRFDEVVASVTQMGRGSFLVKRDLKDAFRHVPLSPLDLWLFGFCWDRFYIELCLPFGLRTAPFIFNLFAEGVHWCCESLFPDGGRGVFTLHHYLDDFVFVFPPHCPYTEMVISRFERLLIELGVVLNQPKSMSGRQIPVLGILVDTDLMEVRLPLDKQQRAASSVAEVLARGSVSFSTLESLIGFLSYCAKVAPLGRTFTRRMWNSLGDLRGLPHHAQRRLSVGLRKDLYWWRDFLSSWNGRSIITERRPRVSLFTDASSLFGIGGYYLCEGQAMADIPLRNCFWERPRESRHINTMELFAVLRALRRWSSEWTGCQVVVHIDNEAAFHAIRSGSIRGGAMDTLRALLLVAAGDDLRLTACWLPSAENGLADAFSRFQFSRVADILPQLSPLLPPDGQC